MPIIENGQTQYADDELVIDGRSVASYTSTLAGTIAGGGTSGTNHVISRVGRVVTLNLRFSITGSPTSSNLLFAGLLQPGFRPPATTATLAFVQGGFNRAYQLNVRNTGNVEISCVGTDYSAVNHVAIGGLITTISFNVD